MVFLYTMCPGEPSVFLYMSISRNGRCPSSSISIVNCMLLCIPFRWLRKSVSFPFPCGQMTNVSKYVYQQADQAKPSQAKPSQAKPSQAKPKC